MCLFYDSWCKENTIVVSFLLYGAIDFIRLFAYWLMYDCNVSVLGYILVLYV